MIRDQVHSVAQAMLDDEAHRRLAACDKVSAIFVTGLGVAFIRGIIHVMHTVTLAYEGAHGPRPSTFLAKVRDAV